MRQNNISSKIYPIIRAVATAAVLPVLFIYIMIAKPDYAIMNALNLAENIIRLRHDKKITQEQLADFVGVTKASVSKWETKQSMPDILLLPQLAAFFDVTIDELLGYEPQLSKEQMQKIYLELASDFAKNPFEEVIERVQALERAHGSVAFLCVEKVV